MRVEEIKKKFEDVEIELGNMLKKVKTSSDADTIRYLISWTRDARNELDKLREAVS